MIQNDTDRQVYPGVRWSGMGSLGDTIEDPSFWGYGNDPLLTGGSATGGGWDAGDWGDLLKGGVNNILTPILKAQYGTPQLAPGTYYSTNAKTGQSLMYALPAGSTTGFASFGGTGSANWLLIGGLGLAALIAIKAFTK